ncbi:hypothetical protein D3C72_1704940 [compost metagenome]
MDRVRHHLLAGPALARQQYRHIQWRHAQDVLLQPSHGIAAAHDLIQAVAPVADPGQLPAIEIEFLLDLGKLHGEFAHGLGPLEHHLPDGCHDALVAIEDRQPRHHARHAVHLLQLGHLPLAGRYHLLQLRVLDHRCHIPPDRLAMLEAEKALMDRAHVSDARRRIHHDHRLVGIGNEMPEDVRRRIHACQELAQLIAFLHGKDQEAH